jgi:16S rRNA (adenine1518-N6/adenine1519-N6)-dimethyltransferase
VNTQPYEQLDRRGLAPKKSLGQNFMVEDDMLRRMADAAEIGADDAVLEIGAGLGALTAFLAARTRRVVAVEIDARYVDELEQRFADTPQVEVVQADILKTEIARIMGGDATGYTAVGNLPYYITSAILRHMLENAAQPRRLVMTVQYEVGQRIIAAPPDMSLLAVSVQFYGRPEIITKLSAGVFYPRPNVDSALMRITPHAGGAKLPADERAAFFRVVRAGFSQPRKKLKNSLGAGMHLGADDTAAWLDAAGIDPARRAETLTVEEWLAVYQRQEKQ